MIDCPHCKGVGKVDDNYLTIDFVRTVFKEWCEVFDEFWKPAEYYGDVWRDDDGIYYLTVYFRGLHEIKSADVKLKYFIRDENIRAKLMKADKQVEDNLHAFHIKEEKIAQLIERRRKLTYDPAVELQEIATELKALGTE